MMIALFTDPSGRVELIHHQPDLLDAGRRAEAALEVESLPDEPDHDESTAAVLVVRDGQAVWEIQARSPDPERARSRAIELASRLTVVDKVRAEALDDESVAAISVLFPPLVAGLVVRATEVYSWDGTLVEIIQDHTTQQDWIDAMDASLYKVHRSATGEPQEWVQPQGEHDAYKMGERATWNGKLWEVTATDANGNNVWEPGVYGWTEEV